MGATTVERLREVLRYDEATGVFSHLKTRGGSKKGSVAGFKSKSGYIRISIDAQLHAAHRLAWRMA